MAGGQRVYLLLVIGLLHGYASASEPRDLGVDLRKSGSVVAMPESDVPAGVVWIVQGSDLKEFHCGEKSFSFSQLIEHLKNQPDGYLEKGVLLALDKRDGRHSIDEGEYVDPDDAIAAFCVQRNVALYRRLSLSKIPPKGLRVLLIVKSTRDEKQRRREAEAGRSGD